MNFNTTILVFFLILLFSGCKKPSIVKAHSDAEFSADYDALLFRNEEFEELTDVTERIRIFEADYRMVHYYSKDWKLTTRDSAVYVNTVKHIEDNYYLVRNYFMSGERMTAGIYYNLKGDCEWDRMYSEKEDQFRNIGKLVRWHKAGRIEEVKLFKWRDWEQGDFSVELLDVAVFDEESRQSEAEDESAYESE